jgi:hypothetical protein
MLNFVKSSSFLSCVSVPCSMHMRVIVVSLASADSVAAGRLTACPPSGRPAPPGGFCRT